MTGLNPELLYAINLNLDHPHEHLLAFSWSNKKTAKPPHLPFPQKRRKGGEVALLKSLTIGTMYPH